MALNTPRGACRLTLGSREVSQGEEGSPEASLGLLVVEGGNEGGQTEPCGAFRPGKPNPAFGLGEGAPHERVAERVDLAGRSGADRHEGMRLGGEDLARE